MIKITIIDQDNKKHKLELRNHTGEFLIANKSDLFEINRDSSDYDGF